LLTVKDDEKALFKEKLTFEETYQFALQNAKDIIACGFDLKKTFIYSDLEYIKGHFLMNIWEFSTLIPFNQVRGAFGFNERLAAVHATPRAATVGDATLLSFVLTICSTNIGRIMFPAVQW
jgi:tryptophanyl-tRNA synthetase